MRGDGDAEEDSDRKIAIERRRKIMEKIHKESEMRSMIQVKSIEEEMREMKEEAMISYQRKIEDYCSNELEKLKDNITRQSIVFQEEIIEGLTRKSIDLIQKNSKDYQPSSVTNHNIPCNNCSIESIIGIRYQCLSCPSYNLCSKCEESNGVNVFHPEHYFIKIRQAIAITYEATLTPIAPLVIFNLFKYGNTVFLYDITITNKGKLPFPSNASILCDEDSSTLKFFPEVIGELKPEESKTIKLSCKLNPEAVEGLYLSYCKLMINDKEIAMCVLKVYANNEDDQKKVKDFRERFNMFNEVAYTDERILKTLMSQAMDQEMAYETLIS